MRRNSQNCMFERMITRYSDIFKLRRAVAWLQRFKVWLKDKSQQAKSLTVEDLDSANTCIIYVQHKTFGDEIKVLQGRKPLNKGNNLYHLGHLLLRTDYFV